MTLLDELEFRGLIYQVTDRDGLAERLKSGPLTLYVGFDPTADSLTIGNLAPILLLRRFHQAGHHPIALVRGGTGLTPAPGATAGHGGTRAFASCGGVPQPRGTGRRSGLGQSSSPWSASTFVFWKDSTGPAFSATMTTVT